MNKTQYLWLENGWSIEAVVDEDGHLNVVVENNDGSGVTMAGWDISADDVMRFTTRGIEDEYQASLNDE